MHGNGVFRNFHGGPENFRAPKITENMYFITTSSSSSSRSLGYTDNPVCRMKPTVLLKSSVVPCSCWCSDMPSGHIWVLRLMKVGQSCSIWSTVWSPMWQVQSGEILASLSYTYVSSAGYVPYGDAEL